MTIYIPTTLLYIVGGLGIVVVLASLAILLLFAWVGWKVTKNF